MKTSSKILKYEIAVGNGSIILVPVNSTFLSVKEQNNKIIAYYMVNEETAKGVRQDKFKVIGTGHILTDEIEAYKFIDTLSLHQGNIMLHIFKQIEVETKVSKAYDELEKKGFKL